MMCWFTSPHLASRGRVVVVAAACSDMKPENILLSSPDESRAIIKIADMGFAKVVPGEVSGGRHGGLHFNRAAAMVVLHLPQRCHPPAAPAPYAVAAGLSVCLRLLRPLQGLNTSCGTPSYVSPDVLLGKRYGAEVDCWSRECTAPLYTALHRAAPRALATQPWLRHDHHSLSGFRRCLLLLLLLVVQWASSRISSCAVTPPLPPPTRRTSSEPSSGVSERNRHHPCNPAPTLLVHHAPCPPLLGLPVLI